MKLEFCVPCLFGLEGIVGNELRRLNMENIRVENGRVLFSGESRDLIRANLWLRCGERVLIVLGEFPARSFDELFEHVKALSLEDYIPKDAAFPVKGHSLNSKLFSIPDCQKIIKKAMVERLTSKYHIGWFEETGAKYQVQFSIMKDIATIYLDTSGAGLHKRGYRPAANLAPIRETLAAAMVDIARYRKEDRLIDPFCGSGTIPIEAAMMERNIAPGQKRAFSAEDWQNLAAKAEWAAERAVAKERIREVPLDIIGSDIDAESIELSKGNAGRAGVGDLIRFVCRDASSADYSDRNLLITNPPYGERLLDLESARNIYKALGKNIAGMEKLRKYIISSDAEFERCFGKTATKKRKLYNGMIKCDLYMYYEAKSKVPFESGAKK